MSFRIEMMSRMMRWQLEIPLRQVLYISFSLAFLYEKCKIQFSEDTIKVQFPLVTKYVSETNWILKRYTESWKVNLLGRGESTGDYVQIGKRWIGILPWQSALWHLPYWNSVPCQPFPTPNSNPTLTGGTWKATQLHPNKTLMKLMVDNSRRISYSIIGIES